MVLTFDDEFNKISKKDVLSKWDVALSQQLTFCMKLKNYDERTLRLLRLS